MLRYSIFILALFVFISGFFCACKKESFITDGDAKFRLSEDTLHFDTVFTTRGSTTQYFLVFNDNDQKLLINNIQLMGGSSSYFKLNIDGSAGTQFSNIELAANDSLYGFATVTINPNADSLPFVIRDSIKIEYNGRAVFLQLEAYGKNAIFLRNAIIDKDTTWNKKFPIVILGELTVKEGSKLTITKGTNIYVNANSPIIVNGTLEAIGDTIPNQITFQGDRLDEPYKNYPGSWPGIYFKEKSHSNILEYCQLKNAYQGVIVQSPSPVSGVKLQLNQCIFDNIYDVAIGGINSSIAAENCLVSNCGYNVSVVSGGNYDFKHCTLASYGNNYVAHKNPVLAISNTSSEKVNNDLTFNIGNSIVYGEGGLVDNEIVLSKDASKAFAFNAQNILYKCKKNLDASLATLTNCIQNQSPLFDSTDNARRTYLFTLKENSPCRDAGTNASFLPFDLVGKIRSNATQPDLGCYTFYKK